MFAFQKKYNIYHDVLLQIIRGRKVSVHLGGRTEVGWGPARMEAQQVTGLVYDNWSIPLPRKPTMSMSNTTGTMCVIIHHVHRTYAVKTT